MTYRDLLMIKGVVGANESPIVPYAVEVHVSPLYWAFPARMQRLKNTLDIRRPAGVMAHYTRSWRLW